MDLTKLMMEFLAEEGFRPQETPFGLAFKCEGLNFLYLSDQDDELYFRLMLPRLLDVNEDNEDTVMKVMNEINANIKVVKLYTMDLTDENEEVDRSVWAAFEILADTTPELKDIVPRAVALLQNARLRFFSTLEAMAANS